MITLGLRHVEVRVKIEGALVLHSASSSENDMGNKVSVIHVDEGFSDLTKDMRMEKVALAGHHDPKPLRDTHFIQSTAVQVQRLKHSPTKFVRKMMGIETRRVYAVEDGTLHTDCDIAFARQSPQKFDRREAWAEEEYTKDYSEVEHHIR
jgi:hypothetical protein